MPVYEYNCTSCGSFEYLKRMSERNKSQECPECKALATRVISAPNLSCVSDKVRHAHDTNERSRHEPKHHHGHNHQCQHNEPTSTKKNAAKTFPNSRPWMIGH